MVQVPQAQYPPPVHVLRDLRLGIEHRSDGTSTGRLPVVDAVRAPSGRVRAGVLATLVDVVGGGLAAATARPDWIATADLTLHLLPEVARGHATAHGRVVRHGRTTVVLGVDLVDDDGTRLGVATMSFAVLPRRDSNPVIDADGGSIHFDFAPTDDGAPTRGAFFDALGVRVLDAPTGTLELPVADYVRNTLGGVQGGVVAATAELAAATALSEACGTGVETVDLQMTYLALGRTGPLRSATSVLVATDTWGTAHVELRDVGAEDRRTTLARVTAARP